MRVSILLFPGSNRDRDMVQAVREIYNCKPNLVWYTQSDIPPSDLIILPGGFSYGDYLRCGAIAARAPVIAALRDAAQKNIPILGICNGFQTLIEAQLLPGALLRNAGLTFVCDMVKLRVETNDTPFTCAYNSGQIIDCPVAHNDGNYVADKETLKQLADENRIAFRYAQNSNPNGSLDDIAGILSKNRRILGLMPHPENLISSLHGGIDGRALFESVTKAA